MLTPTEKFLIELIKGGDKKAFELLFNKYYASLWRYARNLVKNDTLAEDLVMDVFIRLWETASKTDINKTLSAYLFQSVHNHCINYLTRTKKRFPELSPEIMEKLELTLPACIYDNPLEKLCFSEIALKIDTIIESLPDECRKIFLMSRSDGLSNQEIAKSLNISINTVKVQIYRALTKLRLIIKPE